SAMKRRDLKRVTLGNETFETDACPTFFPTQGSRHLGIPVPGPWPPLVPSHSFHPPPFGGLPGRGRSKSHDGLILPLTTDHSVRLSLSHGPPALLLDGHHRPVVKPGDPKAHDKPVVSRLLNGKRDLDRSKACAIGRSDPHRLGLV